LNQCGRVGIDAGALLGLPGDHGRFALAQFGRHVDWLYARDPPWAERMLIEPIGRDGDDGDAVLTGFLATPAFTARSYAQGSAAATSKACQER
jgi:hypothetical protein